MANHAIISAGLGKIIRLYNVLEAMVNGGSAYTADGLEQIRTEWDAVFDADATHLHMQKLGNDVIDAAKLAINGIKLRVRRDLFERFLFLYVRNDIDSTAKSTPSLIGDLYDRMVADSENVVKCTVAVGTVTADAANTGNGTIFVSGKDVWGNDNECIQNEDDLFVCTADQYTGGLTATKETFSWSASLNGEGPQLTVCNTEGSDNTGGSGGGYNRIDNGDFEAFTVANTPDDWDIDAGAVGTHILSDATDEFDGAKCLTFAGDGTQASIQISQSYSAFINYSTSKLEPKGVYVLSAAVKAIGCEAGNAGTLTIQLTGTGLSNSATTDIILALDNTAPTSWTIYNRRVQMPKAVNSDTEMVIKVTGTFTAGNSVRIDNVIFAKMYEFPRAGKFAAAIGGGTDFVAGDKDPDQYTEASTNDFAGVIQKFFTQRASVVDGITLDTRPEVGIHLPSDAAASANWGDSNAT